MNFDSYNNHMFSDPLLLKAFEAQESFGLGSQVESVIISRRASQTLGNWERPGLLQVAALVVPLLAHRPECFSDLLEVFGEKAIDLAGQLIKWRQVNTVVEENLGPSISPTESVTRSKANSLMTNAESNREDESAVTHYSLQLRQLFRQAYLDLPNLSFILLLLADQDARLALQPLENARQTEAVFVPLAQILGLWKLRRIWLEQTQATLHPVEYQEIKRLIAETGPHNSNDLSQLMEQKKQIEQLPEHFKKRWFAEYKAGLDRAEVFKKLEDNFNLRQNFSPILQLKFEPMEPYAGTLLYQRQRVETRNELASRMKIKICCQSTDDCYRVLGVIHRLGKPLTPRLGERFSDMIATPNPNGYRALHTAILFQPHSASGGIKVDFRILTEEMDQINEWGILRYRAEPDLPTPPYSAWWCRLPMDAVGPARRYSLLQHYEVGSSPIGDTKKIYVFTPRGEVILLKDGSTALDFAYHVHTELGHHAARIQVNEQSVPYNYPLHNGDLVKVHYDPHFSGPDLAWLSSVSSSSARYEIRQGLISRGYSIHKGRSMIEQNLLKLIQQLKEEKNYTLTISSTHLDNFIAQAARVLQLAGPSALYDEVEAHRLAADRLVNRFFSLELSSLIGDGQDKALAYPSHLVNLCGYCRPVPNEPIMGYEYQHQVSSRSLKVHARDNLNCPRFKNPPDSKAATKQEIELRWLQQDAGIGQGSALFQIIAEDRYNLLGNILDEIYDAPEVYLQKVEAMTYQNGIASISLIVEGHTLNQLVKLHARLEAVSSVKQVMSFPTSPSQRLVLTQVQSQNSSNPYTFQEVYDRQHFYDREAPLAEIIRWLEGSDRHNRLVLHGQRRVGKTSLARYLEYEILPELGLARPVFIDFQCLEQFSGQSIANCLVQTVFNALKQSAPVQMPNEPPLLWAKRGLDQAIRISKNRPLLIIIDEFNHLLELEEGKIERTSFDNLRYILGACPDLRWLLIVQDTHFHDPNWIGQAGPLLQQAPHLTVPHLEQGWARKLITEPARSCGLLYEEPVVEQILKLTDGNPYLIQVLCYNLINQTQGRERPILTLFDLEQTVKLILNDGYRYFHHFAYRLSGLGKLGLTAIAAMTSPGEWISLDELIKQLTQKLDHFSVGEFSQSLEVLIRQGTLIRHEDAAETELTIPIGLFHRWIRYYLNFENVIAEWNVTTSRMKEVQKL